MEQKKHGHILDCAARFFARFGFRKTSVAEIASEAGVAKGTIYLAASSKQDLFFQVLHREVRDGVAEVSRLIDPRVPAAELIGPVIEAECTYFESRPLVREVLAGHAADKAPGHAKQFIELRRIARSNLAEVVRLGQRQGGFRADLDADVVAEIVQDMQVAALLYHDPDRDFEMALPRWQTLVALLQGGLQHDAAPAVPRAS